MDLFTSCFSDLCGSVFSPPTCLTIIGGFYNRKWNGTEFMSLFPLHATKLRAEIEKNGGAVACRMCEALIIVNRVSWNEICEIGDITLKIYTNSLN